MALGRGVTCVPTHMKYKIINFALAMEKLFTIARQRNLFCSKQTFCQLRNPVCQSFIKHEKKDDKREEEEKTGKDLKLVVSSLRVDRVAATGLGVGRRYAS